MEPARLNEHLYDPSGSPDLDAIGARTRRQGIEDLILQQTLPRRVDQRLAAYSQRAKLRGTEIPGADLKFGDWRLVIT